MPEARLQVSDDDDSQGRFDDDPDQPPLVARH